MLQPFFFFATSCYVFVFLVVFSQSVDVVRGLDGALLQRLGINGTTFHKLCILTFFLLVESLQKMRIDRKNVHDVN